MPLTHGLVRDPDPIPGKPRHCLLCGAKHPYATGANKGICGACAGSLSSYGRLRAALFAVPPRLYRAERPARSHGA